LFVTFRLAGSIPRAKVRSYKAKKEWLENQLKESRRSDNTSEVSERLAQLEQFYREWFLHFEDVLHLASYGPMWMKDEKVAEVVSKNLHLLNGEAYDLYSYCIMSNHVHAIFSPFLSESELKEELDEDGRVVFTSDHPGLSRIMQTLKGRSARECNKILSRSGQFWEHESFDHVVRRGRLGKTIRYVLNNPVKAGLVAKWRDWRWNYCREGLIAEG